MINQKTKTIDRIGKIGASDVSYVMSNWETSTFINWFQSKLGTKDISFRNKYVLAGTHHEYAIGDWYAEKKGVKLYKDRKVKYDRVLVVNLDCETKDEIIEIKTYKMTDKEWAVPKNYIWQVNVQMFVTRKHNAKIVAYGLIEEDYDNFFLPIDETRIKEIPIPYDKEWVEQQFLPRYKYLADCLKKRKTPNMKEFKGE